MRKKASTIGRALGLVVCACTIPACLAAMAAIGYHYHYARDAIRLSSVRRAVSISADVDTTMHGIEIGLRTLSTSPWLARGNLPEFQQQARSVLPMLDGVHSIYLSNAQGEPLMHTLVPAGAALPVPTNQEILRRVAASGRPRVSGLFTGALTHRPLMVVAVPVVRADGAPMVLAAAVTPSAIAALLGRHPRPDGWTITVHDAAGQVVAQAGDDPQAARLPATDALRQAMLLQRSGSFEARTGAGEAMLAAYAQSAYTDWSVSVAIPQHGLMRDLNTTLVVMCASIVVIVGFGLLAAIPVARGIRGAIAALVPAAEALSRSEPLDLPAFTYEETQQVGDALARTSEKLRHSEHHAQHDLLTGLPNRVFLQSVLPRLQSQAIRNRSTLTMLYLDLDGFKEVNDGLGHVAGDEVLFQAAERIREAIRGADIGVRLGGDEFAVLLPDTDRAGAQAIAERIRTALAAGVVTRAGPARVSASIGLAAFPDDCSAVDDLVTLADAAMYRAKRHGKNTVCSAQAAG